MELGREHIKEMYMHTHYGAESIASYIGTSRARLNRAIQKELNMSVQQYLVETRPDSIFLDMWRCAALSLLVFPIAAPYYGAV